MNVKSKYDETDAVKEPKKKYYWIGYGNPAQGGGDKRGNMFATVWDTHMFDTILEKLGVKKKTPRRRSEGDE
jgi:hypothetical protein